MGILSPSTQTTPKPSADGSFQAPNRDARAHCWQARDQFFACLDRNGIVDSVKDADGAAQACGQEGRGFERDCASSWVLYFKKRRVMEVHKKNTLEKLLKEGVEPLPESQAQVGMQGKPPTA